MAIPVRFKIFKTISREPTQQNMPSTPKLSDIWEYTPTEMLGHDSKHDTGKTSRSYVKSHKIRELYQLLL